MSTHYVVREGPVRSFQHLSASNDRSGNPRRLWAGYNALGDIVVVTDEGYDGRPAWTRPCVELPSWAITTRQYRDTLRMAHRAAI